MYDPYTVDSAQDPEIVQPLPRLKRISWSNDWHETELLKFQLMLPEFMQLFKSDPRAPHPDTPIIDLAYFRDQLEKPKIEILVQASVMQHECALRDFYLMWSELAGDEILQMREVDGAPDHPDIRSRRSFPDGQTWVTRQTGYKVWMGFSAFVVTLNIGCEESLYEEHAELFDEIVSSFGPTVPPEHSLAESTRLWSKRYPFDFASYLPVSWKELHHHNDTLDQMRLAFTRSFRDVTASCLAVQAVTRDIHPEKTDFLNEVFSTWTEQGLNPAEITYQSGPLLGNHKTREGVAKFTYHGAAGSTDYEYRFLLAEPENCWFIVELVCFHKDQDFETWAIANRALAVFAENFRCCE
ncbi:MAG: hypothetical protein R3C53_22575 [Pirellulaceae bacterium]